MGKKLDLVGRTFGRLKVIAESSPMGGRVAFLCLCICGNKSIVRSESLMSGNTSSCGCLFREKRLKGTNFRHGLAGTSIYISWLNMRDRCLNKKSKSYKNYGGRGIKIFPPWLKFESFLKDMGKTYQPGLTLERNNVNGNYEPSNCRWIPAREQYRNMRRSVKYDGETATEAALRLGMTPTAVHVRIRKLGWSLKKAFTTPKCGYPR